MSKKRVEGMSKSYMNLRNMVLNLIKEIRSVCEARKQFDSKTARLALEELIELITKVAMEIAHCYSHTKIGQSLHVTAA